MAINLDEFTGRTFKEDLAYSLKFRDEDFWNAFYHKAFPNLLHWELCNDLDKQRQGIDRALYLANSNVLWVDEKKRRSVYPDILLEHTSNVQLGTPGWMEKDLAIDYLVYAFMPIQTGYLIPWPLLRRAWTQYKVQWRSTYWDTVEGTTRLGNGTWYTTHSVAIPIAVLLEAIKDMSVINVTKELGL